MGMSDLSYTLYVALLLWKHWKLRNTEEGSKRRRVKRQIDIISDWSSNSISNGINDPSYTASGQNVLVRQW